MQSLDTIFFLIEVLNKIGKFSKICGDSLGKPVKLKYSTV